MQEWPDAKSWIANSETLLTDLMRLSDEFDEIMMRGPSTPPTFDMGQVEMNWAAFVATARKFSQRLRAAQTEARFPVDATAISRVADIIDELNYGPQRWQTSTDEPDREHTTMEFKELYFEPYVTCHHILADAISTFREYLSLNEMANPETPEKEKTSLDDPATPAKTEDDLETQREKEVRAAFKASLGLIVSDANRTVHRQGQKYSSVPAVKLSPASWELMQQLIAGGTSGVTRKFLATEFKISKPAVSQRKNTLKKDLFALDITIPGDEFRLESSC